MARNPYRWQHDRPTHLVPRDRLVDAIASHLRRGVAVKLVGGRGMGKTVLLRQVLDRFEGEQETRAVLIEGPPEEPTVAACVLRLAEALGLGPLPRVSMDALMTSAEQKGWRRVIVLIDEVDQYVLLDGTGALARTWFNRLEGLRKSWIDRFAVVIAGGLGILHVSHILGSGLVSRAETCLAEPFDREDLRALARHPGARADIDDEVLETLTALSGGIPALATYGLEHLWSDPDHPPLSVLQDAFVTFPMRHADFLRAVEDGVSHQGLAGAPGRVLTLVRKRSGPIEQERLRLACAGDDPPVDVLQAVQLLQAAGLVRVSGSIQTDPLQIHPIASIINLSRTAASGTDPVERFAADMSAVLAQLNRFGRDFHGDTGLLEEKVFSSLIAVGLALLGWKNVAREPVQVAGYADLLVRQDQMTGSILIEVKFWPENDYKHVEAQLDEYRAFDTLHAAVVMIGHRKENGWADDYESACLTGGIFERKPTPPGLVGWWRNERTRSYAGPLGTDHFLVRIPKR